MRRNVIGICTLVVLLMISSLLIPNHFFSNASANTSADLQPKSIGNIPPLVSVSRDEGMDQGGRILNMSVGLALRNQEQLAMFLQTLYDPSSPNYHHYLNVSEFTEQFSPSASEQSTVVDYLTSKGFTVTATYPNRQLIDFSGAETLAEQVFGVSIQRYQGPDSRIFFANRNVPTLPTFLAANITSLTGLDNSNRFYHPPVGKRQVSQLTAHASTTCPTSTSNGYLPGQLATAYSYDALHKAHLQGEGQTVGVFELDGYSQSDVQTYAQCFGGSKVPLQNVLLDGFNGQAGAGAIEVELDIELLLGMDPNLAQLKVYEAPNTTQGYNDEFARIINDRTPVVSVSWGDCEANMGQQEVKQENTFFQEAAAQGQSILVASGDSGSESCFQWQSGHFNFALNADDPAAQPFVTAVGGTTLRVSAGNTYSSESVWNGGLLGGAGGGGISQYWKQPAWQTGPGVKNSYSNGNREEPDVSLNADPTTGYLIYCTAGTSCNGGGWVTVGGTSAAAPMWAAMIVLANQQATNAGKTHLGFLNPEIYALASGSHYARDFHDVLPPTASGIPSNNDEIGIHNKAYPVTRNYDIATGWGSLNADNLATDLVSSLH